MRTMIGKFSEVVRGPELTGHHGATTTVTTAEARGGTASEARRSLSVATWVVADSVNVPTISLTSRATTTTHADRAMKTSDVRPMKDAITSRGRSIVSIVARVRVLACATS